MKYKNSNVKLVLSLTENEKNELSDLLKKGAQSVRVIKRAQILQLFDDGHSSCEIAKILKISATTARRIGWAYVNEGINQALYDAPRPGSPRKISDKEITHIAALVCTDPPEGYDRWSIRLLTEEIKTRGIVKNNISREAVRIILKDHKIKPWFKKNVVCD